MDRPSPDRGYSSRRSARLVEENPSMSGRGRELIRGDGRRLPEMSGTGGKCPSLWIMKKMNTHGIIRLGLPKSSWTVFRKIPINSWNTELRDCRTNIPSKAKTMVITKAVSCKSNARRSVTYPRIPMPTVVSMTNRPPLRSIRHLRMLRQARPMAYASRVNTERNRKMGKSFSVTIPNLSQ